MKKKAISILIRTKNSTDTVLKSLESIDGQSIDSSLIEILVIDDASIDDTVEKIEAHFPTAVILRTSGIGAVKALNFGLAQVQTPYFTILDSDDQLPQDALKKLYTHIESQPNLAAVYGDYLEILENGKQKVIHTSKNIFTTLAGGILFKTEVIKKLGYYDETLFFPEYDVLIKLLQNHQVAHVPQEVYHYVRHSSSLTADKQKVAEALNQITKKYGRSFPIRKY